VSLAPGRELTVAPVPGAGPTARRGAWPRWLRRAAPPAALFLVTFALFTGRPVVHSDEAWFLWVATRVTRGDALYRDVYFVSTPLAAWLGAAAVRVFGSHILVTRALSTAVFTGSTVLAWLIARRCGLGRPGRLLLVVALFAYASPLANFASLYSSLAVLGALGALLVLLRGVESDRAPESVRRHLVAAGALAGVTFAAKPNVGLAVLGVALVVVVAARVSAPHRPWGADLARVVAGFAPVAGLVVAAVAAGSALGAFGADVFAAKTQYLDAFTGGYLPGLRHFDEVLPWVGPPAAAYANRLYVTASLLPIAAVALAALAVWRRRGPVRLEALTLGLFALVAVTASVPRGGPQHLAETAPLFLAAAAAAIGLLAPSGRWAVRLAAALLAAWLVVAGYAVLDRAVQPYRDRGEAWHGVAHFVGAPVAPRTIRGVARLTRYTRAARTSTVFIVTPEAGYYYLAAGLRDPTPYDFPEVSDLGGDDQAGVIRLLGTGSVRWACVKPAPPRGAYVPPTRPVRVEAYVRHHYALVSHAGPCDLYRSRGRRHP
jgi:hypothetical protein